MTLDEQIAVIEADLRAKLYRRDWHGVMDCAADIRELEAQKRVLATLPTVPSVPKEAGQKWSFGSPLNSLLYQQLFCKQHHGVIVKDDGSRWYCSRETGHEGPCAAWQISHEANI
jgi:hypothetical protein